MDKEKFIQILIQGADSQLLYEYHLDTAHQKLSLPTFIMRLQEFLLVVNDPLLNDPMYNLGYSPKNAYKLFVSAIYRKYRTQFNIHILQDKNKNIIKIW